METTAIPTPKATSSEKSTLLIVGLGNPGTEYEGTRHNMGFTMLDAFAKGPQVQATESQWQPREGLLQQALVAAGDEKKTIWLLKPYTFMNASGTAVAEVIRHLELSPTRMLVLSDDLDLPLGKMRLRMRGSAGGHRGILSIAQSLNSEDFPRLKLGIGRPRSSDQNQSIVDWVLGHWTSEEAPIFPELTELVQGVLLQSIFQEPVQETKEIEKLASDKVHATIKETKS